MREVDGLPHAPHALAHAFTHVQTQLKSTVHVHARTHCSAAYIYIYIYIYIYTHTQTGPAEIVCGEGCFAAQPSLHTVMIFHIFRVLANFQMISL